MTSERGCAGSRRHKYHLTMKERGSVVATYERLGSISATDSHCGCSREAVSRWVNRYRSTGDVSELPKSGRKVTVQRTVAEAALDLLTDSLQLTAREVALELKSQGLCPVILSRQTVIRHAKRAAAKRNDKLCVYRGRPRKGLTQETKAWRLRFAKQHINTDWSKVMFTDRKRFYWRYPGKRVRGGQWYLASQKDKVLEEGVFQPSKPNCLNIYAGITISGATHAFQVAGTTGYKHQHKNKAGKDAKNVTSGQYVDVLEHLLFEGQLLFKGCDWFLQMDNDPTHRVAAQVVSRWSKNIPNNVQVLSGWPPNSPDLNLIENFWGYVQQLVYEKPCASFKEFKFCVESNMLAQTERMKKILAKLFASMPKRIAKVLELQGGRTGY